MKLGEKIRSARLSVGMTQAELAGDFITRNMLSQIENGLAMPSLQTALYIADKLGLDAGILFSENEDTNLYFVTRKLPEMKKAFSDGDFDGCIEIGADAVDCDEAVLLVAECFVKKAYDLYEKGRLRQALKMADNALKNMQKCIYSSDGIRFKCDILECLVALVCPLLTPKHTRFSDGEKNVFLRKYVDMSSKSDVYNACENAKRMSENGDYQKAIEIYKSMLRDKNADVPFIYAIYCELEICYREIKDFENAYNYMQDAKKLYNEMQG